MKKILLVFALIMAIMSTDAQDTNESKVAAATEAFRKAMVDADKTALENLTATSLSYGHSSGKVENKTDFIANLIKGPLDFVTIDFLDQTITISKKTAIVRHTFVSKTDTGGKAGEIKIGNVLIWEKQKGGWKLIGRQAFKL
jgi:ketosteroid isomerase-like protein